VSLMPASPAAQKTEAEANGKLFSVPVDKLRFDVDNPRFVDFAGKGDSDIIKFLYEEADLNELIQSISISGFINFEPMLVLRNDDSYVVLEGNRRLGAVQLIRSPELRATLNISIPQIDQDKLVTLNHLVVREVKNREEARAFIGFKHINGPHKWDSLAKAKYAAKWLTDGGDIQVIAKTLGDTHNTVRRLVFGWLVLKQAEDNGFDRNQRTARRFSFSHLYTALSRPGFRSFLGLSEDPSETPLEAAPIPADHLPQLRDLMTWLYGDRSEDRPALIQSQNPDLNNLNNVLQHPEARRYLLARRNLEEAYQLIEPRSRRFSDALIEAASYAKEALSLVPEYDRDPSLLDNARSLEKTARRLVKSMEDELSGDNTQD
jgi:ParB/Sulfiredoxin domain